MYKPRTLADAVDKVARQSAGKDWGLYANLLDHWTEIVGQDYARVTTPVKITFPYQPLEAKRQNGLLTIRLPKGLAMEFSFKTEIIRRRVNSYLGYEAFSRLTLDPAAMPPPETPKPRKIDPDALETIKEKASAVDDPELRAALETFGQALLARQAN